MNESSSGIILLANDRIIDWLIPALASIRASGCKLPVAIIPFDDAMQHTAAVARKFSAEIWTTEELDQLDQVGKRFCDGITGAKGFRKLAAFWGPFQNFMMVDADTVALMNYQELLDCFATADADFIFFDADPQWVFKPGTFRDQFLTEHPYPSFSAGGFLARRETVTLAGIQEVAQSAEQVKSNFVQAAEQPFVNYLTGMLGLRVKRASEIVPDLYGFMWAGSTIFKGRNDFFVEAFRTGRFLGKRFPYIHWAGMAIHPKMPNAEIYLNYRLGNATLFDRIQFNWRWHKAGPRKI